MPKLAKWIVMAVFAMSIAHVQAQKIKYKDVFPLLEARSYEEAIPQLRAFLSDPKNAEDANPNLQMGLYFEYQVNKLDLIADSTAILQAADSAVAYLKKAKELITEKELKKNDEFYQSFYRRDLRTGDFGIKISDVHLDIEKKLQSLGTISENGRQIYNNLYIANAADEFSYQAYKGLVEEYRTIENLLLMSGDEQIELLKTMTEKQEDMVHAFEEVRDAVALIGKKGYSPELELMPISTFGEDGLSEADFFVNDVEAWEYGEWAVQIREKIEGEIKDLKDQLIALDKQLKEENELLKGLESTPFDKITHELDAELVANLKELDENPLPLKLLVLQIKKNEYDFITRPLLNPRLGDEEDVDYQLAITDSLVSVLDEIEKDVEILQDDYIMDGKKKYSNLIEGEYGGDYGLIQLRQSYEQFLQSARSKWREKNKIFTEKSRWGVSADGTDSIYITPKVDTIYKINNRKKYFTVGFAKDLESNTYVIGLDRSGKKEQGFMAMISNSRVIQWMENFELGNFAYGGDSTELIVAKFIPSQDTRVSAYLYSPTKDAEINLVVANAEKVGQINWVNQMTVKKEPISVKFNDLVKETILYMMTEEEMESMTADDIGYYVIDRAGSVR